jgi:hypothetical protein
MDVNHEVPVAALDIDIPRQAGSQEGRENRWLLTTQTLEVRIPSKAIKRTQHSSRRISASSHALAESGFRQ